MRPVYFYYNIITKYHIVVKIHERVIQYKTKK